MNDVQAQLTVRDYVCAHCWGHLNMFPGEGRSLDVVCVKCGPDAGYVTSAYAEARRSESLGEKMEVDQLLSSLGIIQKEKKTEKQLLSELGF